MPSDDKRNGDRRIPSLDGLRAVAISLVVLAHAANGLRLGMTSDPFAPHHVGKIGVRVFFVLSGFLITGLLLDEHERTGSIRLLRFAGRRALRIFPAYFAFLLFVAVSVALHLSHGVSGRSLLLDAIYLANWNFHPGPLLGHLWSLGLEEQFYVLWPFALLRLGRRHATRALHGVILLGSLIRVLDHFHIPGAWIPASALFTGADFLAMGCLLALNGPAWRVSARYRRLRSAAALLVLPATVILTLTDHSAAFAGIGLTLEGVLFTLAVDWCVTNARSRVGQLLNARSMRKVGNLSYSIYLWHVLWTVVTLPEAPWARVPLAALAVLVSYNYIEKPILRLRDAILPASTWPKLPFLEHTSSPVSARTLISALSEPP